MAEPHLPPARHETEDVTFPFLLAGFASVLTTVLLCCFVAMWIFPTAKVDRRLGGPLPEYPAPRLQVNPQADLKAFLDKEMQRLNTAGWVDRAHGIVHIPISDAMRRVAKQGIPDWPGQQEARR
jgi:hypothetical protein